MAPRPEAIPRTWVELDLESFTANLAFARRSAPRGRVAAVMKADAYGHGLALLAPLARAAGAAWIAVGDAAEALELRAAGDRGPLLVLGTIVAAEWPLVLRHGITAVVPSEEHLEALEVAARQLGVCAEVHVEVDTGLGRLGVRPERLEGLLTRAASPGPVRVTGLATHLGGTGVGARGRNREQARHFAGLCRRLARAKLLPQEVHAANSAGLLDRGLPEGPWTLGRPGALLYGFLPSGGAPPEGVRPVLSWRAQVAFVGELPEGHGVGYGPRCRTERPTRTAVLPVGYADGVPRALAQGGAVLLRGRRAAVLGEVSMDYLTVDVSEIEGVRVGDVATLIGRDGDERLEVGALARATGTIPYEILCGLGRRVARRPVSSTKAVG